ncbi:MAG TPA: helix-turn-helix transcriptional regulator [Acidimicrobiales bacterium]|nr:helix-turn-helix transcriptional regulator [Acidimicrobiales bacterium]
MPKQLPDRWGDLGAFIRDQRNTARLSLRRLSELAGISNPYLSQIERGLRRPSAEILQQIAKALRISAETLYVQAGILEPGTGDADLGREILADPFLSEEQKQALIRIYLSFRHENEAGRHETDEAGPDEEDHDDASGHDDLVATSRRRPGPDIVPAVGAPGHADSGRA